MRNIIPILLTLLPVFCFSQDNFLSVGVSNDYVTKNFGAKGYRIDNQLFFVKFSTVRRKDIGGLTELTDISINMDASYVRGYKFFSDGFSVLYPRYCRISVNAGKMYFFDKDMVSIGFGGYIGVFRDLGGSPSSSSSSFLNIKVCSRAEVRFLEVLYVNINPYTTILFNGFKTLPTSVDLNIGLRIKL
jgi:hypothetical protein